MRLPRGREAEHHERADDHRRLDLAAPLPRRVRHAVADHGAGDQAADVTGDRDRRAR